MSYPSVRWGPIKYDSIEACVIPTMHFLVVGSTGSGKTTLIKQLMASALAPTAWRANCRALIYDAKRDFIPFLYALGLGNRLRITNPMDARSHAWDMSKDITSPVAARQVATLLVPDEKGSSESSAFFNQACREVLLGVMLGLIATSKPGQRWTFRDVIGGALNPDFRKALLSVDRSPSGDVFHTLFRIRRSYIEVEPRLKENINASLNAKIGIYEPIAALWDEAGRRGRYFSIEEWAHGEGQVLVLGNDESARASIDALNALIFKRVAECLLSKPEVSREELEQGQGRSWVILDEVREAGNLDGLRSLLNKGRSKGACVVIGVQDVEGLRAEYGKEQANEIIGQCNTVAVLRIVNPDTAEWASGLFGQSVQEVGSSSVSVGETYQKTEQFTTDLRPRVPTCHFFDLPPASPQAGLHGFFFGPKIGNSGESLSPFEPQVVAWQELMRGVPSPSRNPEHAPFIPFEARYQYLRVHTEDEVMERFGLNLRPCTSDSRDPQIPPAEVRESLKRQIEALADARTEGDQ